MNTPLLCDIEERHCMETYEKYMGSFEEHAKELIVRICWFPKEAPLRPEFPDGTFRMRARFDEAIDVQSGERTGSGKLNWLEWTYRKKLFGNPFGHAMKTGSLYRIRARRKKEGTPGNAEIYHVDEVLEKEVRDRRLDPILSFLDSFEKEEKEMLFLNKKPVSGWGVFWGYKRICLTYLACMDPHAAEIRTKAGRLYLLEKHSDASLKADFSGLTAYRLLVRPARTEPETYFVVRNLGKADPALFRDRIEEYRRPVIIENELGVFSLKRQWNWFDGTIQWCRKPCNVLIDVEEGSTDCSSSMELLRRICADDAAFDARVRRQVCDRTMDLLRDWYEEEITEEEYMERLGTPLITISEDRNIDFSFDTGELYAGHTLIVSADEDGNVHSADLAG